MSQQDVAIANVIRKQLGSQALMMIGTKAVYATENGLQIKHSCRGSKTNVIKITLNGLDLYDMEFGKVRGDKYKVIADVKDVYCDQLHEMIEEHSGLYTHL